MNIIDITDPRLLGAREAEIEYKSLEPSTLSLEIPVDSLADDCPYTIGQHYRVVCGGRTMIVGPCTETRPAYSGGRASWKVTISDYFHILDGSTYISSKPWNTTTAGTDRYTQPVSKTPVGNLAMSPDPSQEDPQSRIADTIKIILKQASEKLFPCKCDLRISESAQLVPWVASTSSYLALLVELRKWRPNMAAWWDYSEYDDPANPSPLPVLVFDEQDKMPSYPVDLNSQAVTDFSANPRPDLVPPAVGFIHTTQDTRGKTASIANIWPQGADLSAPGCVIAEYSSGASEVYTPPKQNQTEEEKEREEAEKRRQKASKRETLQKVRVTGKPLPGNGGDPADFWRRHEPRIADIANQLAYGIVTKRLAPASGNEGAGYDASATKYELIKGQIGDETPGLKWAEVILTQKIIHNGKPPEKYADLFPHKDANGNYFGLWGRHVRTMNRIGGTYIVGGDGEVYDGDPPEEEEPEEDPPDPGQLYGGDDARLLKLSRDYYEATRITPYDGSITLKDTVTDQILGRVINISGGRPEWMTMQALVQSVNIDLMTATTRITMGPPKHLAFEDPASRNRDAGSQPDETKKEEAQSTNPENCSWQWNREPNRHPDATGVGPMSKPITNTATDTIEYDFQVRSLRDDNQNITGGEIKHGKCLCLSTGAEKSTGSGWMKIGMGEIFCNIALDKYGAITKAELSDTRGPYRPYQTPPDNAADTIPWNQPGYYSFLIAEVTADKIIQRQIGTVLFCYTHGGSPLPAVTP